MAEELIPIVQRSYDLCAGLYEHVNRFPRAQRTLLGRVILEDALQMLVVLTVANRERIKSRRLDEASGRLDALRITLRLATRLGFLSNGGYERVSGMADEVGRMLGGWLKHEAAAGGSATAPRAQQAVARASPAGRRPTRGGGVRYTMTSPTIERYLRLKLARPEAIVFIRAGAFYQTLFEDAALCARELKLAVRNLAAEAEPAKILACGFPLGALERYGELLRQRGWEVHVEEGRGPDRARIARQLEQRHECWSSAVNGNNDPSNANNNIGFPVRASRLVPGRASGWLDRAVFTETAPMLGTTRPRSWLASDRERAEETPTPSD
jgi:hypothetical protein